jgi:glucose/arabinose dehydrogenase
MRRSVWVAGVALGALVFAVVLSTPAAPVAAQSQTLLAPWNLVAAGESGTVEEVVGSRPEIASIHRWNATSDQFENWVRGAPSFLNDLETVSQGDGLWVRVDRATSWPLGASAPVLGGEPFSGWRLIGWTAEDASAATVAEQVGATRVTTFDAGSQEFLTFDPRVPSVLNTLSTVQQGDGVWVLGSATPSVGPVEPGPVRLTAALGGELFSRPIELGPYPGGRVFVAEQDGFVRIMNKSGGGQITLLDMLSRVSRAGNEEGLLSVALDPSFPDRPFLYAYYSVGEDRRSRLSRFTVFNDRASLTTELVILDLAQPFRNHNGGAIRFGPDGMLYLGLGDGGSGGDPLGSGQDLSTLLGSIIRIDVRNASALQPYAIPSDNPFVNTPGARDEIWAYGLRNPWRMAFDEATGTLWVGDVGQSNIEEVDTVVRGGNYGWNRLEGNSCFQSSGCSQSGTVAPVATYNHGQGCSITGGVVARGGPVAAIEGAYLYGDFCSGTLWAVSAIDPGTPVIVAGLDGSIASFGLDDSGVVYVLGFSGPIMRVAAR